MFNENYGEFVSSYMADNFMTGARVQPNPNNPKTRARAKMRKHIAYLAEQNNADPSQIATGIVQNNIARVDRYIATKGETPANDLTKKMMQAHSIRTKEVNSVANAMGITPSKASIFLDEAESKAEQMQHPDSDNFLGEIFSAIGTALQPVIDNAAAKRAKSGKPAGFYGTAATGGVGAYNQARAAGGYQNVKGSTVMDGAESAGQLLKDKAQGALDIAAGAIKKVTDPLIDKASKSATQVFMKKYLPVIIGSIVVIATVIYFVSRRKK